MGTTTTPNLGLIKPDGNEPGSNFPAQHGSNQDTIDTEVTDLKSGHSNSNVKRVQTNKRTSDTSGITTTETVTQTVVAALKAGKTYRVSHYGRYSTSVAPTHMTTRIREDSVSGSELTGSTFEIPTTSAAATTERIEGEYTPVSDENKTFVSTLIRGSGTGSTVCKENSFLYVDYVRG